MVRTFWTHKDGSFHAALTRAPVVGEIVVTAEGAFRAQMVIHEAREAQRDVAQVLVSSQKVPLPVNA